jgi:hypothetical protein
MPISAQRGSMPFNAAIRKSTSQFERCWDMDLNRPSFTSCRSFHSGDWMEPELSGGCHGRLDRGSGLAQATLLVFLAAATRAGIVSTRVQVHGIDSNYPIG